MTHDVGGLVLGIAIGIVIAWLYFLVWKFRYTASIREDAVQRSLAVTAGQVDAHRGPYLPQVWFYTKDARLIRTTPDPLIFARFARGDLRRVVFVSVATVGSGGR